MTVFVRVAPLTAGACKLGGQHEARQEVPEGTPIAFGWWWPKWCACGYRFRPGDTWKVERGNHASVGL